MSGQHEAAFRDAEQHLTALRNAVNKAGGPCHTCKHGSHRGSYSWDRICHHPFVRRGTHDAVSGKVSWRFEDQRRMRESTCGEAGTLHEQAALPVRIWRFFRTYWGIFPATGLATYFVALIWIVRR